MKKFIVIVSILVLGLLIAGCNTGENDNGSNGTTAADSSTAISQMPAVPSPHPAMQAPQQVEPTRVTEPPAEPIADLFPVSDYYFTLTAEERAIYEQFLVALDPALLYGLSPISVTKLYVQAGIDGEWEAEFYMHNLASMEVTKEQFYENHLIDMQWSVLESRQSLANWVFPHIDDATIVEVEDDWVVVVFDSVPEPDVPLEHQDTLHIMNLYRNEDGIWQMRFRPHAFLVDED